MLGPAAVEEMLRYDSPVQLTTRLAKSDMEIHGTKINQEEWLYLVIRAANRDPAQFRESL
jgi:cytochrome P450